MGYLSPAKIEPQHYRYYPSVKIDVFSKLVDIANATANSNLIDGLVQLVIDDINSDNAAGNIPNQLIRDFYRSYYDCVQNSTIVNNNLIQTLNNLT